MEDIKENIIYQRLDYDEENLEIPDNKSDFLLKLQVFKNLINRIKNNNCLNDLYKVRKG